MADFNKKVFDTLNDEMIAEFKAELAIGTKFNPFCGAQVFAHIDDQIFDEGGDADFIGLLREHGETDIAKDLRALYNDCQRFDTLGVMIDNAHNEVFGIVPNIIIWKMLKDNVQIDGTPIIPAYDSRVCDALNAISTETMVQFNHRLTRVKTMAATIIKRLDNAKVDPMIVKVLKVYLEAI